MIQTKMENMSKAHTFCVEEIDADEVKSINGGYWFLIALGIYLYDNRATFLEGVYVGIKDFQ